MCYDYELGVDLNVISRVFAFVKYVASLYCTLYVFNELISTDLAICMCTW